MSEYRERLQVAMIARQRPRTTNHEPRATKFYTVCETLAYALFLTGWALCIVCHM